jgi:hypothetical protein
MDTQVNLSKWNPFKFLRNSQEEKRAESPRTDEGKLTSLSSGGLTPLPFMLVDPFRMIQSLFGDPLGGGSKLESWFGDFSPNVFRPRIDVVEDSDAFGLPSSCPAWIATISTLPPRMARWCCEARKSSSPVTTRKAVTGSSAHSVGSNA